MSFRLKEEAAAARQWAEDRGINDVTALAKEAFYAGVRENKQ